MYNTDIRNLLKESKVSNYALASMMGISETSLSQMMARRELSADEKAILKSKIKEIKDKRGYFNEKCSYLFAG